jgi:hypothetical protein
MNSTKAIERLREVLLHAIRNEGGYPTNLIARLLHGCGLCVSEHPDTKLPGQPRVGGRACAQADAFKTGGGA